MLLIALAIKACALLTASDVATVLGEKPTKVRASNPRPGASQCSFTLRTGAKAVSLEVMQGPRAAQLADRLRQAAEVESEEAGEDEERAVDRVPGLGDEAFWAAGPGGLYVWRAETLLRLTLDSEASREARLAQLCLLARKALPRLPK